MAKRLHSFFTACFWRWADGFILSSLLQHELPCDNRKLQMSCLIYTQGTSD